MTRQELDDLRMFLLISLGQQHSTRRLKIEFEVEGDDDLDPRRDLQDERQNKLSPCAFSRSLFETGNANEDIMTQLARMRDNRALRIPTLKELRADRS